MKLRKKTMVFVILFFFVLLSACVSESTEKSGYGEKVPDLPEKVVTLERRRVYSIGEPACVNLLGDFQEKQWEYTVEKAEIFETPQQAGLHETELLSFVSCTLEIEGDGDLEELEQKSYQLLLCDVKIRNLKIEDKIYYPNIDSLKLVYEAPDEKKMKALSVPVYFSNSLSQDPQSPDYYHYDLPEGSEIQTKIAWRVDLETYKKENLFLGVHYDSTEEVRQYIDLDL